MDCPYCDQYAIKYGTTRLKEGNIIQTYYCRHCKKRFNERTATPMANLRTPKTLVASALKIRTEGTGIRATVRDTGKIALYRYPMGKACGEYHQSIVSASTT